MSKVKYTNPNLVTDMERVPPPPSTQWPINGYGDKLPCAFMLKYNGRVKRVYAMVYGNSGTLYIIDGKQNLLLDVDTEWSLRNLR